jgi:prepilin-type processing-associated H-X9-DG protein
MGQVAKDPVAALYLDVDAAVAFHDQIAAKFAPAQAKPTIEAVKEALGIKSLKRIAWGAGFDAKEWSSQAYLESPEPRSGLVKFLLEAKPLSDQALRTIPATATMAAAGHFDLGGLLGTVREMVRKIDPPTSQDFEGGLDQVKQMIGMDLQGDILDTLGDEWVVYSNPAVGGSGILGLTVVNRLKEPAKAEQALGQLEKLLNGMMKEGMAGGPVTVAFNTVQQGDLTIHYLAVPFVAPSWAIKDGVLYAGLYPQVISGAYEHVKSGGKSILDNPDFVALRKRLTPEGRSVTAISYSDLPKVTTEGYQEVLMLARVYLGMADLFGAKTPAMAMPTLTKLLPHVTPAAGIAWPDKDGYHFKEISPFPGSQILAAGGMGPALAAEQTIFMGVALPALAKARINANRIKSASNLRMIGQAMLLYANENKGKYPAEMGELLLTQDITIDVFVNPETRTRAPRNQDKEALAAWVSKDSDYEYLGAGKTNQTPPNVIVAHEKFRPNAVGVNLLFGDGHVEFLYKQAAEQAIAKQKQDEIMKKGGK